VKNRLDRPIILNGRLKKVVKQAINDPGAALSGAGGGSDD
jgi:hypothetical protein